MSPRVRVIGLGQAAAGDDGAGLAVIAALRARGLAREGELVAVAEASALVPLLETPAPVMLVDALWAWPPGEVLELGPEQLGAELQPLSSHGMSVAQAVALARLLSPETVSPTIRIVAVTIDRPRGHAHGLSPAVAAAVERASERIARWLHDVLRASAQVMSSAAPEAAPEERGR